VTRRSLRLRLLLGGALYVGIALLIAGVAISYLFITNVERGVRLDLAADFHRLVALIDPTAAPPALREAMPDPRYATPLGGLYWQIRDLETGAVSRSRSLWDFVIDTPAMATTEGSGRFATLQGPSNSPLSALLRQVRFSTADGPRSFLVVLAQDRTVIDESIGRFGRDLAIALLVLSAVLLTAAWLQVQLGLAPLQKVRAGIEAIRRRGVERLPETYPDEVLPLVGEVNELLASQQRSIEFARARAADLAHGLKTPLSVLEGISARLRQSGDAATAGQLENLTAEMADRIDYQLRLSRLRMRTGAHRLSTSLSEAVTRTISVLERTQQGERLRWQVQLEAIEVDIDRNDLLELVGVLLENAVKWAENRVTVTASATEAEAILTIGDDGPGLSNEQIDQLGIRGRRLDETRAGSGLGLAIALEIVALNAGHLSFGTSPDGGLLVTVTLPCSEPALQTERLASSQA
jgi:signal transduction histidine kinase